MAFVRAGFFLALLLERERCYFVDNPFFKRHFVHELDLLWNSHKARLRSFNFDPEKDPYWPRELRGEYDRVGGVSFQPTKFRGITLRV
jgi:hypothetical protein